MNTNITQTLSSLKSAMKSDKDQILEDDDKAVYDELETSVSDGAVEVAINSNNEGIAEQVFSSEDEDVFLTKKKEEVVPVSDKKVFILSKMINDEGKVVNLNVEGSSRPVIDMSEEKIECIVREEAKFVLKEWIEKNMHKILKSRKK